MDIQACVEAKKGISDVASAIQMALYSTTRLSLHNNLTWSLLRENNNFFWSLIDHLEYTVERRCHEI